MTVQKKHLWLDSLPYMAIEFYHGIQISIG